MSWIFDDLLRVGFRQRAAEHGEILGEGEHGAAVDGAEAGDHAVAGDVGLLHAEIGRAVLDEHVELLERAAVHQKLDALARGELAALVLRLDAGVAAALARADAAVFEPVENVFHGSLPIPLVAAPDRPEFETSQSRSRASLLQQTTRILTVGALGNDMAAPMGLLAAASQSRVGNLEDEAVLAARF